MSLKYSYASFAVLVLLAVHTSSAQLFTDQGMMSGSGLMILPTATIAPASEMQVQYSRLTFLQNNSPRANVLSLSCGFSSSLEGYARFTSEELRTISSQSAYSFGAKFRFPGSFPVLRRLALWGESTFSDMQPEGKPSLFPVGATRGGIVASLDSNGFRPSFFIGGSQINNSFSPLIGGGITIALGHRAQLGGEFLQGYFGKNTNQSILTGSVRIFSNVSLHISPGYFSADSFNGWMISGGFSLFTADVDYHQVNDVSENKDDFRLPSIDELEKQMQEEKK